MTDNFSELERQRSELKGASDLLFELREEFAQWVEEAQDASKHEALENVLVNIEVAKKNCRSARSPLSSYALPSSGTTRSFAAVSVAECRTHCRQTK
jgi:cob(I)alamin adenosyltransferase